MNTLGKPRKIGDLRQEITKPAAPQHKDQRVCVSEAAMRPKPQPRRKTSACRAESEVNADC